MARRTLTEEEKLLRRRQILDGAVSLIAERGYDGTSMGEIAGAAGLSTGALYLHFMSKQDIYLALYHEALEALDRSFDDALDLPVPDVRTRLCMLFYSYINFYKSHYAMYRVLSDGFSGKRMLMEGNRTLREKALAIFKRVEAPLVEGVLHGMVKPCDTFKTTITLWAMFDGILMLPTRMTVDTLDDQYQSYYSNCLDVILNGILV